MTKSKQSSALRTAEEIFQAALKLSPDEREKLVARLKQHRAPAEAAAQQSTAWADEMHRRVELLRAGKMHTVSADEAIERARARLRAGRK